METSTLASQMSALPPIPKLLIRGVPSLPPADSSVQMERMAAAVESSSKQMSELMSCMGTFMASMAPKVPKRKAEEPAAEPDNDWTEEDEGEYRSDSESEREEPQEEESEDIPLLARFGTGTALHVPGETQLEVWERCLKHDPAFGKEAWRNLKLHFLCVQS